MSRARLVLAAVLALGLGAGCEGPEREPFPAGSTMARLQAAGTITIGVKYDQPGVGFRNPATGEPEGFDIEIASIVARRLGIDADRIVWRPTVSKEREGLLQNGEVDLVVASYSITRDRSAKVGQAGPYYVAHQQLLVRSDDERITGPDKLAGVRVCSVTGSTSLRRVATEYAAQQVPTSTYTECVVKLLGGSVDAVSTDDVILRGYLVQQPHKLKLVGPSFHDEPWGIGHRKGDREFCEFLTETIALAAQDGSWAESFDRTLGRMGVPRPSPPTPDHCRS